MTGRIGVDMIREYTNKILELVNEGVIDQDTLIRNLLDWMSEQEVKDFAIFEGYVDFEDDDGQPDEAQEWRDYDSEA
jgi:hypothetical protein